MRYGYIGVLLVVLATPLRVARGQQTSGDAPPSDTLLLSIRCQGVDGNERCNLWGPSLVELIARPELYDGRRIRVIGFINLEFESNHLYLSREDWEHGLFVNGVLVRPPPGLDSDSGPARKRPNRQYVIVEGTFNAHMRGHLGVGSGGIDQITRLDPWNFRWKSH